MFGEKLKSHHFNNCLPQTLSWWLKESWRLRNVDKSIYRAENKLKLNRLVILVLPSQVERLRDD